MLIIKPRQIKFYALLIPLAFLGILPAMAQLGDNVSTDFESYTTELRDYVITDIPKTLKQVEQEAQEAINESSNNSTTGELGIPRPNEAGKQVRENILLNSKSDKFDNNSAVWGQIVSNELERQITRGAVEGVLGIGGQTRIKMTLEQTQQVIDDVNNLAESNTLNQSSLSSQIVTTINRIDSINDEAQDLPSNAESTQVLIKYLMPLQVEHSKLTQQVGEGLAYFRAAIKGGFKSPAWQKTPTLRDFLYFCSLEHLSLNRDGGRINEALEHINLRLRFWLTSRVGQAISAPSSFPTDAQLLVFALRNLSDSEDAAVLSLSAYSAALRRVLSSPASIFFIDEAPILFEFDQISDLVGRLCANGAKAGVRVILSAQDPDTIAKSKAASKILQNLSTRLIGRIQPVAIDSFERILRYPREIISRNASESFFPKKKVFIANGCWMTTAFILTAVIIQLMSN